MILVLVALLTVISGCSGGIEQPKPAEKQAATQPAPPAPEPAPKPAPPPQKTFSQTPAPVTQVRIPAGSFIFGVGEPQFKAFMSHSLVNFPGMIDKFRKTFVTPPREVKLPAFSIDQFEVTNEQYREFIQATGYQPADTANYLKLWGGKTTYPSWAETFPVVWISQQDAEAYCKWRSARLPTEEEWEKAGRGTDGRMFPWGNVYPSVETANFTSRDPKAEPVGNRSGDKSPYEVYDMGGNVAEITATTVREDGQVRAVIRGGTYLGAGRETAVFNRILVALPGVRSETTGCRCVKASKGN